MYVSLYHLAHHFEVLHIYVCIFILFTVLYWGNNGKRYEFIIIFFTLATVGQVPNWSPTSSLSTGARTWPVTRMLSACLSTVEAVLVGVIVGFIVSMVT